MMAIVLFVFGVIFIIVNIYTASKEVNANNATIALPFMCFAGAAVAHFIF